MMKTNIILSLSVALLALPACGADQPLKVGSRDDIIVNNRDALAAAKAQPAPMIEPAMGEETEAVAGEMNTMAEEGMEPKAATAIEELTADEADKMVAPSVPTTPAEPVAPLPTESVTEAMEPKVEMPEVAKPAMETPRAPAVAAPEVAEPATEMVDQVKEEAKEMAVETPTAPAMDPAMNEAQEMAEEEMTEAVPAAQQAVETQPAMPAQPAMTEKVYVSPYVDTSR